MTVGINSNEDLARRCRWPVDVITRAVATQGESLSARELLVLCRVVRRRAQWLMDEDGPLLPITEHEQQIIAVAASLSADRIEVWLAMGRWIARARREQLPW